MESPFVTFVRFMPRASRRLRRSLVAAAFLGFPLVNVGYLTLVAPGRLASAAWAPVSIALFAATLIGVVAIYGYARGRADMKADLDERQRQVLRQGRHEQLILQAAATHRSRRASHRGPKYSAAR